MDQHIGTGKCKYFSIKFDAKQLGLLDIGRLPCVHSAGLFDHIAHRFDEKCPRPARRIENSIILIYVYEPIHELVAAMENGATTVEITGTISVTGNLGNNDVTITLTRSADFADGALLQIEQGEIKIWRVVIPLAYIEMIF